MGYKPNIKTMTAKERFEYIDCLLKNSNIEVHKDILVKVIKAVDIVDESKGKIPIIEAIKKLKK